MKTKIAIAVLLSVFAVSAYAQNYTSVASGTWSTPANWNNTSGWGASIPAVNGSHSSGTITLNHDMTITSAYTIGSATLNIAVSKTLTVQGAMILNGGSDVTVSGNLIIYGDLTLNSNFKILPGGSVMVNGSVIVNSDNYLQVGTNANTSNYADLIIKNDLRLQNSGDATLYKNARVAVFGNVTDNGGGGTFLRLNNGAQMYVDGNIAFTGGGNDIINGNGASPYGLYVNGTTSNTGGGSATTSNRANRATMNTTNIPFANWVNNSKGSLMPVNLLFFEVSDVNRGAVVLKWATASEENFDYFIIESSSNGAEFNEVGRVNGHGTTTKRNDYTFDVVNPAVGKTYFRLKSVDYDQYTETFKVVSATYEAAKEVKVYPNPVSDLNVNIDFNFVPSEGVVVSFTNITGTEVFRTTLNGMQNLMNFSAEPGTYIVKITSSEVASVSRLQVL